MHRDNVTHVVVARLLDFIITGSCDGHVKFWKKMMQGIEFVKHFQVIFFFYYFLPFFFLK